MRALVAGVVALAVLAAAASSAATDGPRFQLNPAWSPDGKSIAFSEGDGTSFDIWVMDADGTDARPLTHHREARLATWSPDSKRLAVDFVWRTSNGDGFDGIALVNADGTGFHEIVHRGANPAWSPGGRKIAFSLGDEEEPWNVYAVNPDGTNRRLVAREKTGCSAGAPTWSPDGQRIAFGISGGECGLYRIGMVTQYGGRIRTLSRDLLAADSDWSPGGRLIAYTEWDTIHGTQSIGVLDLKTGRHRTIHPGRHPSWSPNSRRIVFADTRGGISSMNADGSEVVKLYPR
jgi:Tol biopolymer transport system component